ncbi:MAG TPA: hypothetical protein PKZ78_10375, partial [Candidatus Goldiibacteriota bacterium]|nr:hypothetical protein [Candidatus Goldiibacteriota bacterium]
VVTGCDPLTNGAYIDGDSQAPVYSNIVIADVQCGTPTNTVTLTATRTNTPSATPTPSRTPSPTSTSTRTSTPTMTVTVTITDSPSPSPTRTATPTMTVTVTVTDSPSPSPTRTATTTVTFTSTVTVTRTNTETSTPTPTITITYWESMTNTPTVTETKTITSTATPTVSFTGTPTVTHTATVTVTRTDTPTSTPTPTITVTYWESMTNTPTNTPTATVTVTFTITDTRTATRTATPTNTITFTVTETAQNTSTDTPTITLTATNSITFTNSPTRTATRTITQTATETITWTDTPTVTLTSTETATSTETLTITETTSPTSTPTITPTLPPFPYIVRIGVYNSAGELVKIIAESRANNMMSLVRFTAAPEESNVQGTVEGKESEVVTNKQVLEIFMAGLETPDSIGTGHTVFEWGATNNAIQDISNGSYYIKIEQKDEYGHSNVLIKEIQVIKIEEYVEVNIYNSGGELVRVIKENRASSTDRVSLKIDDMLVIDKNGSDLSLVYGDGVGEYIRWDGLNNQGKAVSSGTYEIQVIVKNVQGQTIEASKTVIILNEGKKFLESVLITPNPVDKKVLPAVLFRWTGSGFGEMTVSIYTINGELVRRLSAKFETFFQFIPWDLRAANGDNVAQGYYVVVFEAVSKEGFTDRKVEKLAIK